MIHTEWQAKKKFAEVGIELPVSVLLSSEERWPVDFPTPSYAKAQVLHGGRGKDGLVVRVDNVASGEKALAGIREATAEALVMAEQAVAGIERYASIGIDPVRSSAVLTIGHTGGVDIEDSARDSLGSTAISMRRGLLPQDVIGLARSVGIEGVELNSLALTCVRLWHLFVQEQAHLVEINPLIWDGSRHWAADAKLMTFEEADPDGLVYFDRPGRVAVLSAGAGLGMAVGDALNSAHIAPANFSDIVGGVSKKALDSLADRVIARCDDPKVEAMIMVFSLSNTPIETVLGPLCNSLPAVLPVPTAAYLSGVIDGDSAIAAEMHRQLADRGIQIMESVPECVSAIAEELSAS